MATQTMKTNVIARLLAASAVALGTAAIAGAQTTTTTANDTTTSPTRQTTSPLDPRRIQFEGNPVNFSLADVVIATFRRNLDIEISNIDARIAEDIYRGAQGIYDPTLSAAVRQTRVEGEQNSLSAVGSTSSNDPFVIDQTTDSYNVGLTQLLPTGATVGIGFDRAQTRFDDQRRDLLPYSPEEDQRAFVSLRQPLLKNFGPTVTNSRIRTSRLERNINDRLYEQEIENRLAETMRAYWDLVFAIGNLDVQTTALEAALELERVNSARVDAGSSPRSDLFQAQARVANRRNLVIDAKRNILDAQDRLLRLMNWYQPMDDEWNRPIVPTDTPLGYDLERSFEDQSLIADALANRADLVAIDTAIEVARINKDVAWWQRFPQLDLVGEYGLNGMDNDRSDAFDEITDSRYEDYFYGLEFRYPILNRSARADYRAAKKRIDRAGVQKQRLELAITTDVRFATRNIRSAQEAIEASDAEVRAAQETLGSERSRLDVGASTTFNVLSFQEDLAVAQVNQLQARVNYQKGLVELERSRGLLIESLGQNLGLVFGVRSAEEERAAESSTATR